MPSHVPRNLNPFVTSCIYSGGLTYTLCRVGEASLVVAAALLAVIALGILVIMLRLSRQFDNDRRQSSTAGNDHDDDDDVTMMRLQQLRHKRTCSSAVNVTVNPVDQLLYRQHQVTYHAV